MTFDEDKLRPKDPNPDHGKRKEAQEKVNDPTVDRLLFSRRLLLSLFLYQVYETEKDQEKLKEWKQDIDAMIEQTHRALRGETTTIGYNEKMKLALGETPTQEDVTLFCISRFIQAHRKTSKKFHLPALKKVWPGGAHTISELGTEFDTCVDTAALTQVLAELYGISGAVVKPVRVSHYHWQQDEGKRAIIDTFWLQDRYGYLQEPETFKKVAKPQP